MRKLALGLLIGFLVAVPAGANALGLWGTKDIKDFAITKSKLHSNSVNSIKIIDGAIQIVDISATAKTALKGAKGIQGIRGATGTPGPTYAAGTSISIIDTTISISPAYLAYVASLEARIALLEAAP